MLLRIYQFITYLCFPLIDLYLMKRKMEGKEDPKRSKERLGKAAIPRPIGDIIWFHGASVGESLSILPLVEKLSKVYPKTNILITTGTVSSAKMLESRLPDRAFHQYLPIDIPLCVNRFLNYWQPSIAIWVESELWPNLITSASKKCPLILVNGRISEKSFNKWMKYDDLGKSVVSCFSLIMAQSPRYAERYEALGGRNVKIAKNLKYDSLPLPVNAKHMGTLVSQIGDRPLWLAASTHSGEEEVFLESHIALKEKYPNLLTIIVPRHIERKDEIVSLVSGYNLNFSTRSEGAQIKEDIDIYIADTMGELGVFYRLASIAFIGGSLITHGGQNPLEAARLDCAVIFGPHMENFQQLHDEMIAADAATIANNAEELTHILDEFFTDYEKLEEAINNSKSFVDKKSGAVEEVIAELVPFFDKVLVSS